MKDIYHILQKLTILYAEDDVNIRQSSVKTYELLFDKVFVAHNGQEALDIYEKEHIHIVMLDYVMPKLDGYEVAKKIRHHNKNIPIIISSGYTDQEKLLKAIELNLVKYLIKPVQYDNLSEVLSQSIEILKYNNMLTTTIRDDMSYDYLNKKVIIGQKAIMLTKQEIRFIEMLLQNMGNIVYKEEVIKAVFDNEVQTNTLRNMVYRLRKKLERDLVYTVKDVGYML